MKKFKNIVYIAILSLLVVSCEDNTDSVTNPGTITTDLKEVKVSFTDDNTAAELQEGETTSFRVGMPAAIDGTVVISINVSSSDGDVEAVFPTSITLEEGQSAKYFDVTPKDDGVSESETYTVEITDVQVNFNSDTEFFVHNGDVSRTIAVKDLPTIITVDTTPGPVDITLNWSSSEDLDLYLRDEPGFLSGSPNLDTSWFSQPENMTMGGFLVDGAYYIGVDNYLVPAPFSVACTLVLTFPDGQSNIILTELTEFIWIEITKTTSGATVNYEITIP